MSHLDYPFGFLAGYALTTCPDHFERRAFPLPLFMHPDTPHAISMAGQRAVALIGDPVDPDRPEHPVGGIADDLCRDPAGAQMLIDRLVGRFAVIQGTATDGFRIQTDAIAMRSVYFENTNKNPILGSHASLVSGATQTPNAERKRIKFSLGYPGIATPWKNVDRLPPNLELSLQTGRLSRFFPNQPLQTVRLEDAWRMAMDTACRAARGMAARHPLLMSLTAGLDSRATLAAVRPLWPEIRFFTYTNGNPKHDLDVAVATEIARTLRLDHKVLDYSDIAPNRQVMQAIRRNTFANHQHKLSAAYRQSFGEMRPLHIRTNLLEITRSNLFAMGDRRVPGGPGTAEKLASYYARSGKLDEIPAFRVAFADYLDRTGLQDVAADVSRWDLFFIEHRMGAWHAGVVAESDIAFDTTILFNSRRLIATFMGAPQIERSTSDILKKMIFRKLPEIANIQINPVSYNRLS